tara:strand:+ start:245 stop:481 length:237 start_codon:yes stop_codon:yes gene_type:complete
MATIYNNLLGFTNIADELGVDLDEFYVITFRRDSDISMQGKYTPSIASRLLRAGAVLTVVDSGYITGKIIGIEITLTE